MRTLFVAMFLAFVTGAWAKAPKLPMPQDVADELNQLFAGATEKTTTVKLYRPATPIKITEHTFTAANLDRVKDILDEYVLSANFTEKQARRIGQFLGVRTLPSFDARPAAERVQALNSVLSSYSTLPLRLLLTMKKKGKGIDLVAFSVTEHPEMQSLANVTPRGWPAGSTWNGVPGVGAKLNHPTIIAGMALKKNNSSRELVIHEVSHSIDKFYRNGDAALELSTSVAFMDLHKATPMTALYGKQNAYFKHPEENLAEMMVFYFKNFMSREHIKKAYPAAAAYFEDQFDH